MNIQTLQTNPAVGAVAVTRRVKPGRVATASDVLPEFVWAFQTEARRRLESLSTALAEGAADMVQLHARRLRNNALNVGAVRLAEVCDLIEQQATVGRLPVAANLSALLFSEFENASSSL